MNKKLFYCFNILLAILFLSAAYFRFYLGRQDITIIIAMVGMVLGFGFYILILVDKGYFRNHSHRKEPWFQYIFVPKKFRKEEITFSKFIKSIFGKEHTSERRLK